MRVQVFFYSIDQILLLLVVFIITVQYVSNDHKAKSLNNVVPTLNQ